MRDDNKKSNQVHQVDPQRIEKAVKFLELWESFFPSLKEFNEFKRVVMEHGYLEHRVFSITSKDAERTLGYSSLLGLLEDIVY